MKNVLGGLLALTATVAGLQANAADFKDRTLRVSNTLTEEHPLANGLVAMNKCMVDKSGGLMKLQAIYNAALGGDTQSVTSMRAGSLDMATVASSSLVSVLPEMGLFDLPFLVNSEAEADKLLDGKVGQKLSADLEKSDLVNLGYWENGFRQATNSRHPITKWEDFNGLKFRVLPSHVFIDTFKTLGANPIAMDFTEVIAALEMGAIDGADNTLAGIYTLKMYEVQKYMSLTHHVYGPLPLVISKKKWDELSGDEKGVLRACANVGRDEERRVIRASDKDTLQKLKDGGIKINEVTPAEIARMKAQVAPVYDTYAASIGADVIKMAKDEVASVKTQ